MPTENGTQLNLFGEKAVIIPKPEYPTCDKCGGRLRLVEPKFNEHKCDDCHTIFSLPPYRCKPVAEKQVKDCNDCQNFPEITCKYKTKKQENTANAR